MKANKILILIFVLILFISIISSYGSSGIFLGEGKNKISFNLTEPFYVNTFVKLNPDIEAVSFFEGNKTIGYINFAGGIGENFVIKQGVNYEIFMREDATIIFP